MAAMRPLRTCVAVWLLLVQPVNALLVSSSLIKYSPHVSGFNPAPPLSFRRISAVTRGGRTLQSLRCTATNDAAATEVSEAPPLQTTPPKRISVMVEPTPFTHVSGYSNRYMEMLDYLKKADDSVSIMTTDDSKSPPEDYKGYPIFYTPGFRFSLYNHLCLSTDLSLIGLKMLKKEKPQVLHISTPGFMVLVAAFYARMMDVPVVMSYHTHLPIYAERYLGFFPFIVPISWLTIRFIHSFADLTLVTSPQMQADFTARGVKRVEVWRKGINTERFNPKWKSEEMRNRLSDGNPEDTLLIYVGRLGREKRLQDLRKVMDANPKLRLAIVGQGPYKEDLEKIFEGTKTVFTGQLQGEPLWQAFASADMFVMPSDSETLGFVVLEAMASGIPVVGVRAGGVPDLVKEGENGYLVEPGDMDAFGTRVREMSDDREKMERFGRAGREWAEKWSWESATSVLRNLQYPLAIQNAESHRASLPAPLRFGQLLIFALGASAAVGIITLGCAIDDTLKILQGKDIRPPEFD